MFSGRLPDRASKGVSPVGTPDKGDKSCDGMSVAVLLSTSYELQIDLLELSSGMPCSTRAMRVCSVLAVLMIWAIIGGAFWKLVEICDFGDNRPVVLHVRRDVATCISPGRF